MGDLPILRLFLTNLIDPASLTALTKQLNTNTDNNILSLSGDALKYLTESQVDSTNISNINTLSNLNSISITGLSNLLAGSSMPSVDIKGLTKLDLSDNGMIIENPALDHLSDICNTDTLTCKLGGNCIDEGESTSFLNVSKCQNTNGDYGDYDDLITLLEGILNPEDIQLVKDNLINQINSDKSVTHITTKVTLLSTLSISSNINLSNLSMFDISNNNLSITQPYVKSLSSLCTTTTTNCTLFNDNDTNCAVSGLTYSSIQNPIDNTSICSSGTPAPTPVPPEQTPVPTPVPPGQTPVPTPVPPEQTPAPTQVPTGAPAPTQVPSGPQITGLRIINDEIILDYTPAPTPAPTPVPTSGFSCPSKVESSLGAFSEPMIGYWYYAYPFMPSNGKVVDGSGQGETPIKENELIEMATRLGLTSSKTINTYFNLASGAVLTDPDPPEELSSSSIPPTIHKFGSGTLKCNKNQGDPAILQPYPPSASDLTDLPYDLKNKVLNIGGWGNWTNDKPDEGSPTPAPGAPVPYIPSLPGYWTTNSMKLLFTNINKIITYMKDSRNNYNVLSIDIEGIHGDDNNSTFGNVLNDICKTLVDNGIGSMITLPGFGVKETNPPQTNPTTKDGMKWFEYVEEKNVTRLCLMYYGKINDTAAQFPGGPSDMKKFLTNTLISCYPANKKILGLSCKNNECEVNNTSLLDDQWIKDNFKGGISMWRKYYGTDDQHGKAAFVDPVEDNNAPKCPFKTQSTCKFDCTQNVSHTVVPGDDCYALSTAYKVDSGCIFKGEIKCADVTLSIGDKLTICGGKPTEKCITIPSEGGSCPDLLCAELNSGGACSSLVQSSYTTSLCTNNCKNCTDVTRGCDSNASLGDKLYINSNNTEPICPVSCLPPSSIPPVQPPVQPPGKVTATILPTATSGCVDQLCKILNNGQPCDDTSYSNADTYCTNNCTNCKNIARRCGKGAWEGDTLYIDSDATPPTCPT